LVYDASNKHFSAVQSPIQMFRDTPGKNSRSYLWCYGCSFLHLPTTVCHCENPAPVCEKRKRPCEHCGADIYKNANHQCDFTNCNFCHTVYKNGDLSHRCPVYSDKDSTSYPPFIGEDGADSKKSYNLIVYDLESSLRYKEGCYTKEFLVDDDGKFVQGIDGPEYLEVTASQHVATFVCWENVFTGEVKTSENVGDFVNEMVGSNGGRNICLAHNGSGYDTRLMFDEITNSLVTKYPDLNINPVMRGSKILQLSVRLGKERIVKFQDTMLHLPGSLAKISSEYLKGRMDISTKKGFFPHLFNRDTNREYVGVIPDRKYFDLAFTMKDDDDLIRFNEWYETWNGRTDW